MDESLSNKKKEYDLPPFSVSMCVYGGDNASWFKTAVDSILNQSVTPNEIVLIVDGPVPGELDKVISEYEKNSLFNIIRFKENRGQGEARRVGLKNCKNNLVAIMDSDDISVSDRFKVQLEAFNSYPAAHVIGGQIVEFIDKPENTVGKRTVPAENTDIYEYMKKRCPMNLVTVMFKKDSVEKAGGFIDLYGEEDYYLWVRMAKMGMKFFNVPETLVNVRVGKDMYNRRGGIRYFKSEKKMQKYMLESGIIGLGTYTLNVLKRFIVQVLMPNAVRGWVFKNFAREKV